MIRRVNCPQEIQWYDSAQDKLIKNMFNYEHYYAVELFNRRTNDGLIVSVTQNKKEAEKIKDAFEVVMNLSGGIIVIKKREFTGIKLVTK